LLIGDGHIAAVDGKVFAFQIMRLFCIRMVSLNYHIKA
jgi:hypothetical protein